MSDSHGPAVKKRVQPYPIETTLDLNGVKKGLEIILLTPTGFLARLKPSVLVSVGQYYSCVFELPVMHNFVNTEVRVIKTYDRSVDPKVHLVERMAEFHFEGLSVDHKNYITSFLSAIGQKRA